jgi:hypothetical protein
MQLCRSIVFYSENLFFIFNNLNEFYSSPLWSDWDIQCVKCKPGWMFKNYRCIINFENIIAPYNNVKEFCISEESNLIFFYDDVDLQNCVKGRLPGNGYFVSRFFYN